MPFPTCIQDWSPAMLEPPVIQTPGRGSAPGGKQRRTTSCPNQSSYRAAVHQLRPISGAVQASTPGMLPTGRQGGRCRGTHCTGSMPWGIPLPWGNPQLLLLGSSVEMLQDEDLPTEGNKFSMEGKIPVELTSSSSPEMHKWKANQNKGTNCKSQVTAGKFLFPYQTNMWFGILIHPFKALWWVSEI